MIACTAAPRKSPVRILLCPTGFFRVVQIGETVLRNFMFVHLEQPADKLQLLLAMMHKLYAMITRQCCDDNPDALIHHEVPFSATHNIIGCCLVCLALAQVYTTRDSQAMAVVIWLVKQAELLGIALHPCSPTSPFMAGSVCQGSN